MEVPARFGFGTAQLALGVRQLGENAPRLLQTGRARIGQRDRAGRAVDQPRPEPRLERCDTARYCGRGAAKLARRGGKAALARDRDKHFEGSEPVQDYSTYRN